jgi:hypothetical protein
MYARSFHFTRRSSAGFWHALCSFLCMRTSTEKRKSLEEDERDGVRLSQKEAAALRELLNNPNAKRRRQSPPLVSKEVEAAH